MRDEMFMKGDSVGKMGCKTYLRERKREGEERKREKERGEKREKERERDYTILYIL